MPRRFSGIATFENEETGDDRMFLTNALNWTLPLNLFGGHDVAADFDGVVGTITSMERLADGVIQMSGQFLDNAAGCAAAEQCRVQSEAGVDMGVSVDLDDVSMELRIRSEVLAGIENMFEPADSAPQAQQTDEHGRVTVGKFNAGDFMTVFTGARIRGVSLTNMPAFNRASIAVMPEEEESPGCEPMMDSNPFAFDEEEVEEAEIENSTPLSLVAGAYPVAPPAEWFENPGFTAETPLTVEDSGRIYGHCATFGQFHIAFAGQRIECPRSMADYGYFRTGLLRTENGTDVPVGQITMTTGHAENGLSRNEALAHYDNTGAAAADVACGEDEFGIWFAGALRPDLSPEQVRELRAASLSGDWREIRGNLELVAVLAVNTPGFPIPRMSAMVASGGVRSLTASAAFGVEPDDTIELTREEKLAIREMVRQRNDCETGGDVSSDDDKIARAELARRRFRAERAKIRALRGKVQ